MTATRTQPFAPLSHTFKLATLGLVASAALFAGSPQAHAGTTEIKFLTGSLSGTQSTNPAAIAAASSSDLANAVVTVLTANAAKYNTPAKAALIAGEALKYNQNSDAAEMVASAIQAANISAVNSGLPTFVATTGKTAGTGKALNVNQIPDFAAALLGFDGTPLKSQVATETAILAKNKPAAGAILAGQAEQFSDDIVGDNLRFDLANSAGGNSKLKAGIQDIARYIGATANSSPTFVERLAGVYTKSALKIATGVAAGDPTNAGDQAVALYGTANATLKTTLDKGISTFAKSVTLVSDIEEIPQVAATLAGRISAGAVKISKATSLLSTMIKSVLTAPAVSTVIGANNNNTLNRKDEAAEIAAYFVGALGNTITATNDPTGAKAAKLVYGWIKASVKAFNNTKLGFLPANVSADITASIVLTVQNLGPQYASLKLALKDLLFTGSKAAANVKAIQKDTTTLITAALGDVYSGNNLNKYENGTDGLVAVADPETDVHPYN